MKKTLSLSLVLAILFPAGLSAQIRVIAGSAAPILPPSAVGSAAALKSPGLDFGLTPQKIAGIFDTAKLDLVSSLDRVAAVPAPQRSFKNTVAAIEGAYTRYQEAITAAAFMFSVSPDKAIRDAARDLDAKSDDLFIELSQRDDIYQAVKEYAARGEALQGEEARLLEATLLGFRRDGMELAAEKRVEMAKVQKRLAELGTAFSENLKDSRDALELEASELRGVDADFVASLPRTAEGKIRVGLDYPTYRQVMRNAQEPETRRRLGSLFNNQAAKENVPILEEALGLRQRLAELLGYKNYAEYAIEPRMAKSPQRVWDFLHRLKDLLFARAQKENDVLLEYKRREVPGATKVESWDFSYYARQLMKERYEVDSAEVQQYFPVDTVVAGTLEVYQRLLGVRFQETKTDAAGVSWHPDVRLFEITDKKDGRRIGWFYLDLHPREGKYKHAAAFSIRTGHALEGGGYQEPVSAMVANFTKPQPGKPSLLTHGEVETFFHEFGHLMHQTLTTAEHASFAGSRVARDFVEAPSQMLENFVWQPEVVDLLSGHWQDPAKKLPRALLDKMLAARGVFSASDTLGQVALAALDLVYHTAVPVDSTEVMRKVFVEFEGQEPAPGTHFQARFGHVMGGYSAGYYGYLWSKVFALDIFSRFLAEGILNEDVGLSYRREILERGSSRDEEDSLRAFLGREPSEEAFLRSIGVEPETPEPPSLAQYFESAYGFHSWLADRKALSGKEALRAAVMIAAAPLFEKGALIVSLEKGVLTLMSAKDPMTAPAVLKLDAVKATPEAERLAARIAKAAAQDKAEGGMYFRVAEVLNNIASIVAQAPTPEKPPLTKEEDLPLDPARQPQEYLARKLRDAMRSEDPYAVLALLKETRTDARRVLDYGAGSKFLEGLQAQGALHAARFMPGLLAAAQEAAGRGDKAEVEKVFDAAKEYLEYAPGWYTKTAAAWEQAQTVLEVIAKYGPVDPATGLPVQPATPDAAPPVVQ
ncbi:MAG: M3 family metallopeptidase [Elusimicrobiota bacterium]|jgi:thimet oligopeptidase